MVASGCYCGMPLKRAAQYIGIADVLLGLLNAVIYGIHLKEIYEDADDVIATDTGSSSDYSNHGSGSKYRSTYQQQQQPTKYHIQTTIKRRTFHGLDFLPTFVVALFLVCHSIQLIMGIVLYIAAGHKNRGVIKFWLVITGITALFSGILVRLYEMVVVNEFNHELNDEQEVTYFPGHNHPGESQYPQQPPPPIIHQPYPVNPPMESNVSVIGGPTGYSPMQPPKQPPTNPFMYYGHQDGSNYYPSYQPSPQFPNQHHIPAALQPPPRYDTVVNSGLYNVANSSANGLSQGDSPNTSTTPTVMFPNEQKSGFETKFSKF